MIAIVMGRCIGWSKITKLKSKGGMGVKKAQTTVELSWESSFADIKAPRKLCVQSFIRKIAPNTPS